MNGRIIEISVLIASFLVVVGVMIAAPLTSYNDYKEYLAQIEESKKPVPKPVLESISIQLKEGVKYFANDMAKADNDDFIVYANYTIEGGDPYSEELAEDQFTVSTAVDFYSVGGEITVSFKGKTAAVSIELIPVQVEKIELVSTPYVVKYQAGTNFNPDGMVLLATYNDGTTKKLTAGYEVDVEKALTTADKSMTVSYTEGGTTKTASVPITVTETFDDGNVIAMFIEGDAVVQSGSVLANAVMNVSAVYESGNRKPLSRTDYIIAGENTIAKLGKSYKVTLSYNNNPSIELVTDVVVRNTVQGENCTIVGGTTKTEAEYVVTDGNIVASGKNVTFAGDFAKSVLNGSEGSISFSFTSESETLGNITMRCGNSYCCFVNGTDKNDGYIMRPLQINNILDLYVNGKLVAIPASVVLKGCGPNSGYAPLFGIYYEFTFEDIELNPGVNTVKLMFKKSANGAVNCWGESPSTLNIDYINVDAVGNEIPDDYVIESLEISPNYNLKVGQSYSAVKPDVIATLTNGTRIFAPVNALKYELVGSNPGETVTKYDKYTLTVSLISNPAVSAVKEFELVGIKVLTAGLESVNGKINYVFTGNSYGYVAADLVFFSDEKTYTTATTFDGNSFTMKIDVTNLKAGTIIYPHLKVKGNMYYNGGANKNGDIRGTDLVFTEGQSIMYNGQTYTIRREYEMPVLVIPAYSARVDAKFDSDKTLLWATDTFKYGDSEVATNGTEDKTNASGGIGNLDKSDKYITYTFTVDKDGVADFVWNIAGSKWNSSTGSNDGINNLGAYVAVTIDGKPVILDGIVLPAGSGDAKAIWWNLQKVVIENVELSAGTHTFTVDILTSNGGINVASLELHFKEN